MEGKIKSLPDPPPPPKAKGVHFHQVSITREAKGTSLRRNRHTHIHTQVQRAKMAKKYLSIITLNVNGLKVSIKRQRVAEWIRIHDLYICCLQETHLRKKDLYRLKVKE